MVRNRLLFVFLIMLAQNLVFAQKDRYMVFLKDKDNSTFSTDQPLEFLSQKAIDRREGLVTTEDLPVVDSYVQVIRDLGIEVYHQSRWFNAVLVQMSEEEKEEVEMLGIVDNVEYVAPGSQLNPTGRKAKLEEDLVSVVESTTLQNEMLGIDVMHRLGYQGQGVSIAITDGGFLGADEIDAFQHVYAGGKLLLEYNFVDGNNEVYQYDGHGTNVFSSLAGFSEDVFTGTAYEGSFMLFLTEDVASEYRIEEYNWLFAAEMADSAGVDIIHASLGYTTFDDFDMNYSHQDLDGETTVITQAANIAASKGILVVSSAGNEGNSSWQFITPPADSESVLAIGSVNASGEISSFSSVGPSFDGRVKPDLMAIGSFTALINGEGELTNRNGTSFSSPLVTGLAAGVWQANPTLDNFELMDLLKRTADNATAPNNNYGYGIPSFEAVINYQQSIESEKEIVVFSDQFRNGLFKIWVQDPVLTPKATVQIINSNGQNVGYYSFSFSWLDNERTIPLDTYPPGTYFFRITTQNETSMTKVIRF